MHAYFSSLAKTSDRLGESAPNSERLTGLAKKTIEQTTDRLTRDHVIWFLNSTRWRQNNFVYLLEKKNEEFIAAYEF